MGDWANAADGWQGAGEGVSIRLYSNDKVPSSSDVIGDYTAVTVAGATGATGVTITGTTTFPDGTIALAPEASATFSPDDEPDPALTAYGWFICDNDNTRLIAACRFDNPVQLHQGIAIVVFPIVPAPAVWQFTPPDLP